MIILTGQPSNINYKGFITYFNALFLHFKVQFEISISRYSLIIPIRSSPGPIFTAFIVFDGRDYTPNMHQKRIQNH